MPDRYADAVRARRAELRAQHLRLRGGHRTELRNVLALAKIAAVRQAASELAALAREARRAVEQAGRADRRALPGHVANAVDAIAERVMRQWEGEALPAIRRIATERGLPVHHVEPVAALSRATRPVVSLPAVEPPERMLRAVLSGPGWWRIALVPAAGVPVLGGADPLVTLVCSAVLVAVALWLSRVAADRERLRRWVVDVVAAARTALDAEIGRRALELEQVVGAHLDVAIDRQRAAVEAELRLLAAAKGRSPDVDR